LKKAAFMQRQFAFCLIITSFLGSLSASARDDWAEHVFYIHSDDANHYSLMELKRELAGGWSFPGQWRSLDLPATDLNKATRLVAYVMPDKQRVIYQATDGAIHELLGDSSGNWQNLNVTQQANLTVLPPSGTPLAAYTLNTALPGASPNWVDYVDYVGVDKHVHELEQNNTGSIDIDLMPGSAIAAGNSLAVFSNFIGYLDANSGDVHALSRVARFTWRDDNLTSLTCATSYVTCAPPAVGIASVPYGGSISDDIVYVGQNGHVYSLYSPAGSPGSWLFNDLTKVASAPSAAAATSKVGIFLFLDNAELCEPPAQAKYAITYISINNDVHQLRGCISKSDWTDSNLSQEAYRPTPPLKSPSASSIAVFGDFITSSTASATPFGADFLPLAHPPKGISPGMLAEGAFVSSFVQGIDPIRGVSILPNLLGPAAAGTPITFLRHLDRFIFFYLTESSNVSHVSGLIEDGGRPVYWDISADASAAPAWSASPLVAYVTSTKTTGP
jgi:hypothetical protein